MWDNYQAAGYSRLVYTNTAAVRADVLGSLLAALGGHPVAHAVLLTATDETVVLRLGGREIGSGLDAHLDHSRRAAPILEEAAPEWVRRINTDGCTVADTARRIRSQLGWESSEVDQSDS